VTVFRFNLPPVAAYQREAIFCEERAAIIEATTKAGKTVGCLWWQLREAGMCPAPASEHWWIAPIYDQTRIAYRRMVRLLMTVDPSKRSWDTNKQELSVTLGGRAVIRYRSGDDPDSLYGEDVYSAVIDEASRCKEDAWFAVRSTLTATRGRLRIIGNVKGRKNWAYHLARRVESGGLPGWRYAKITAYDAVKAGILDAEEVEQARRELPEAVFNELYLGIPTEDGSNPFGIAHINRCVRPGLSGLEPEWFGVDLAKSHDWTVVIGLDSNGDVAYFDRWQGVPWPETTARVLRAVGQKRAYVDSTGVGDAVVDELRRTAPWIEGYKFTQTSKQQLMEGLATSIQGGTIGYPDGPIRSELESFEYQFTRTGGVRYTAPEGMHDDCVCALALADMRRRHSNVGVMIRVGGEQVRDQAKSGRIRREVVSAWDDDTFR